jgi:hypothetical protein
MEGMPLEQPVLKPADELSGVFDEVFDDFQEEFGELLEEEGVVQNTSETLAPQEDTPLFSDALGTTPEDISELDPHDPRARIARIEKKISELNATHPEYMEERMALEEKKLFIQGESISSYGEQETEELVQDSDPNTLVENLLSKPFSHTSVFADPETEEKTRLEKARKAAEIEHDVYTEPKLGAEDERLREAVHMRTEFLDSLTHTTHDMWYENPSQNRDAVNEYVHKTAQYISGKKDRELDMNDIQTARLFLFHTASEDAFEHPAYKYVESFYNYNNDQGFSGEDVESAT